MVNFPPSDDNKIRDLQQVDQAEQPHEEADTIWSRLKGYMSDFYYDFVASEDQEESLEGRVSYQRYGDLSTQNKVSQAVVRQGPFGDVTLDNWPDPDEVSGYDDEISYESDSDDDLETVNGDCGRYSISSDEGSIEDDNLVYYETSWPLANQGELDEVDDNVPGSIALHQSSAGGNLSTSSLSSTHFLSADLGSTPTLQTEVQKIIAEGKSEVAGGVVASQAILSKVVKGMTGLGYQNLEFKAELAGEGTDGNYELEAYSIDSAPGKVFYQIKVNYRLVADPPASGGDREEFSFERTIYTTATNPEDAIRLAMQFKEMVGEYAMKDKLESEFDQAALSSRTFTFNFSRNGMGTMTHQTSIQTHTGTGGNQKNIEKKELPQASPKKIFFNPTTGKEWDDSRGRVPRPGFLPFDTPEQLTIFKKGFTIRQDYLEFSKNRRLDEAASELKSEIKKSWEKFDQIAARYVKGPEMLNQFATGAGPSLSDEVEAILSLTEGEDFDVDDLDDSQKKQLSSLTDDVAQLYRLHQDLKAKQGQLKSLSQGANNILSEADKTDEDKNKANEFLTTIAPTIDELEQMSNRQSAFIAEIGARLGDSESAVFFDASDVNPPEDVV